MGHHHASHDHSGHHHDHTVNVTADNQKRVFWAMVLTFGFMLTEVVGGLISGSLALLADAGHMFSDALALMLSWLAFKYSNKDPDERCSFGWHRFQILAAFVNGLTLLLIAVWIVWEAIDRFLAPVAVMATPMLVIAVLGLLVNVVVFKILSGGDQHNLNLKSAMLHVMGDLLGSVAAIIAALLILFFGWFLADPILSILVALLILKSGWAVVKKSAHILIEGTPEGLDLDQIKTSLRQHIPEINDAHHLHVWSLTNDITLLTLHVNVDESTQTDRVLEQIKTHLHDAYGIHHTTIQIEHRTCPDEAC